MSGYDPRGVGRLSATVHAVIHWSQQPGKRQDVDRVVAEFDFAIGEVWWLADEGAVKVGDRFMVTIEAAG